MNLELTENFAQSGTLVPHFNKTSPPSSYPYCNIISYFKNTAERNGGEGQQQKAESYFKSATIKATGFSS